MAQAGVTGATASVMLPAAWLIAGRLELTPHGRAALDALLSRRTGHASRTDASLARREKSLRSEQDTEQRIVFACGSSTPL
jgi:hypothetical protein